VVGFLALPLTVGKQAQCGITCTSLSYRTKDMKCSEVNGKRQHKFIPLKKCACNLQKLRIALACCYALGDILFLAIKNVC
jgi:hypothetical protein